MQDTTYNRGIWSPKAEQWSQWSHLCSIVYRNYNPRVPTVLYRRSSLL